MTCVTILTPKRCNRQYVFAVFPEGSLNLHWEAKTLRKDPSISHQTNVCALFWWDGVTKNVNLTGFREKVKNFAKKKSGQFLHYF